MKSSNESVLWESRPSQAINLIQYTLSIIIIPISIIIINFFWELWPETLGQYKSLYWWLMVLVIFVPSFRVFWLYLSVKLNTYQITDERLHERIGILTTRKHSLELYRVKDTSIEKPFWLRLLGLGNIIIDTSDKSHPQMTLQAIKHAERVQSILRDRTEQMRKVKGVREFD